MALPDNFTFDIENDQYLKWTLADGESGSAITDATVTATLYANRDKNDPIARPGTAVTNFSNIALTHQGSGVYRGLIPHAFAPGVGGGYVLVVIATQVSGSQGKWEIEGCSAGPRRK